MTEKKNNFKRISENRVAKILALFNQLKNLTNTSFYEYTDEEVEEMFKELEDEMAKTKKILLESNKKGNKKVEL